MVEANSSDAIPARSPANDIITARGGERGNLVGGDPGAILKRQPNSMTLEAYEAAKHGVALADVSAWGKLAFRGPDRQKFLHGLLTNDIESLKPGQGVAACLLTPKGGLVASLALYDLGDQLLSIQLPQATTGILAAISKPLMLSQTTIENASDQWAAFLIIGPRAPQILRDLLRMKALDPYACVRVERGEESLIALSHPTIAPEGTLVLVAAGRAEKFQLTLLEQGRSFGLMQMGSDVLEILRVEAGVPVLGVDTDDGTLPLELAMEHAISFTKGCYLGQETTARIKNFGHVNRRFVGLTLKDPASPQAAILFEGTKVGKITSIIRSPKLGAFLALGIIRYEQSKPGTRVFLQEDGGELAAEVTALPLT